MPPLWTLSLSESSSKPAGGRHKSLERATSFGHNWSEPKRTCHHCKLESVDNYRNGSRIIPKLSRRIGTCRISTRSTQVMTSVSKLPPTSRLLQRRALNCGATVELDGLQFGG